MGTIATMDLTTELLDNAAFREAKRGYNTQEVDDFIEQVKLEYGRHDALARELRQHVEAAEGRIADAERRAVEAAERAASTSDADDTLKRTLVLAQRTADAAIKEAEEQAARTVSSAQDQAARMLADAQEASARARADAETEARRAQEDARARVLAELHDLETARDQLQADVGNLERHLEEQRDRVRLSARELQRLLDDPAALLEAAPPLVSDVASAPTPMPAVEPLIATPPPAAEERKSAWGSDEEGWAPEPPAAPAPLTSEPEPAPESASVEQGAGTQTIDLLEERDADDDAYLAELRKAMTDESPLGPREEGDADTLFESSSEPSRSRFGRRR